MQKGGGQNNQLVKTICAMRLARSYGPLPTQGKQPNCATSGLLAHQMKARNGCCAHRRWPVVTQTGPLPGEGQGTSPPSSVHCAAKRQRRGRCRAGEAERGRGTGRGEGRHRTGTAKGQARDGDRLGKGPPATQISFSAGAGSVAKGIRVKVRPKFGG